VTFFANMLYVLRLNPHVVPVDLGAKPWLATALWGGWMRHRGIMLQELIRRDLARRCLITYLARRGREHEPYYQDSNLYQDYQTPEIPALDLPEFNNQAYQGGFFSMCPRAQQHGSGWISQLIPRRMYDSALVSIVSETLNLAQPDTLYISEKISRPLLLAQPFWVMAAPGFLAWLQELGFQTYGAWWDESYDHILDTDMRARAVITSFAEFAGRPLGQQLTACFQARSVAMHNRQRMQDLRWLYGDMAQYLRRQIS
jgi:hypothetical protein